MPRRFVPLRRSSPFRRSRIFWILVCIVFLLLDMTISLQESANRSSRRELEDIWMSSPIRPSALVRLRKRQAPLVHFKKVEQHTPRSKQVVLSRPSAPAPFCSMEQYTKGKWQERAVKPQSLADIRNQSSLLESAAIGCHPLEWPVEAKGEVPLDHPDHLARLLESAQWQWVPEGDCRRHEIDVSQMVKRLLRSKGGLVLVGDSLSEQHFAVIQNILVYPGGPWDIIGYGDRPRMAGIKLNPDHPLSAGMLEAAGVSKSRCDTPIVTLYLERHLISREEMDGVMDFASDRGYTPFSTGNGLEEWVSQSIWFDEYNKTLSGPAVEFVGEAKEEKTVLLLNSGAHWVNGQFTREMTDFYPELLRGWDNLIDLLNAKIATLPLEHQQVIWRATSPGHPHCEFSSTPEDRTDIRSKIDPSFNRYNWEIFDKYNAKWEEKLSPLKAHERSEPAPIMEYLDIWPISVTRPDAHLLPPNDCLHFCYGTGGVIEEWQKLLWHKMMGDARNADYASRIPVYR